jgi:hypothetical protein
MAVLGPWGCAANESAQMALRHGGQPEAARGQGARLLHLRPISQSQPPLSASTMATKSSGRSA